MSTKKFFFYFQDEHIEFDNLGAYFKKEKKEHQETAQSTAAYASQSGKGLLFFVKNESQKAQPTGIIKLVSFMLQPVITIKEANCDIKKKGRRYRSHLH